MSSRGRPFLRIVGWLLAAGLLALVYSSLPAGRPQFGGFRERLARGTAAAPGNPVETRAERGLESPSGSSIGALALLPVDEIVHSPRQPGSGTEVLVTARVSKSAALERFVLQIQSVDPGAYVGRADKEFEKGWQEIPLHDDGLAGDAMPGDGIFSARVGSEHQKHRRLVRYRLRAVNARGIAVGWPESTNACPNRAWLVHDGLPAWSGASRPGKSETWTFTPDFLSTLPAYQLVARRQDVERSQWNPEYNRHPFFGTLVYEGQVYDHIQYHNRGQGSSYVSGKNKWGFKFPAGHEFHARDAWGRPYRQAWKIINLNACASPWAPVNRGMAGLDEAVSYRAYQLAGVPAPDTHWVGFRVIDAAEEAPAKDQYGGDTWGLYLVVEEKNGTWLREHGLPDGNIYSAEAGTKHLAAGMPKDGSDLAAFIGGTLRSPGEHWWKTHLDRDRYYTFHALNRVLANIDLRQDGNYYLHHRPDGRWVVLPHDLDMMFIPKTHWPGVMSANACLRVPAFRTEYRNRAREILDLFCADPSPAGGQVGQLVHEMAGFIAPKGSDRTWAELDEAVWNWHPRSHHRGQFNKTPTADGRMGGHWTRHLATPDFDGFCRFIVDFCTDTRPEKNYRPNDGDPRGYGFGFLWTEAWDDLVPPRPVPAARGAAEFPVNALGFEVSAPSKSEPAKAWKVQWRVAEIRAPGLVGYVPGQPFRYEIESGWTTNGVASQGRASVRIPSGTCQSDRTYRVRARYGDNLGRWGHWSAAVQFVPTGPAK